MSDQAPADVALALAELRRLVEVGFEKTSGQTGLILQRLDHVDGRHAELVKRVDQDRADNAARNDALERRLDAVERDAVTRSQLTDRTRQIIAIVGLMVAMASGIIALINLTQS